MNLDEGSNAAIRVGSAYNRQKTAIRAAVDRACLQRVVDRGFSRGARGSVRMISRQPPSDSVATHRFRTFASKEPLTLLGVSNHQTPVALPNHYRALNSPAAHRSAFLAAGGPNPESRIL